MTNIPTPTPTPSDMTIITLTLIAEVSRESVYVNPHDKNGFSIASLRRNQLYRVIITVG